MLRFKFLRRDAESPEFNKVLAVTVQLKESDVIGAVYYAARNVA